MTTVLERFSTSRGDAAILAASMRFRLIVCGVLLSQVLFALMIAAGAPCLERCEDDQADGRCPPACVTCPCSPRLATARATPITVAPATQEAIVIAVALLSPHQPEPDDISHVPKSLLA